jgi:hypothetical protein
MNGGGWILLCLWIVACLAMVLALVPYSMELMEPSADFCENRRRLRATGAIGRATAWCVPRAFDDHSPRRFWGAIYFATWTALIGMGLTFSIVATAPGASVAKNVAILLGIASGFGVVHAGIIALGRAINRANQRDRRDGPSADPDERLEEERADEDEQQEPIASTSAAPTSSPSRLSNFLGLIGILALVIALRIISDHLPVLHDFHAFTQRHPIPVRGVVIGAAALGFVTFMTSALMLALGTGAGGRAREMSHEEVEDMYAQNVRSMQGAAAVARVARYRIRGETYGRTGYDEWSFRAMKDAWRSGAWRSDPIWRRRYLATCGALLMTVGLFGIPSVFGPPWVMLLCGLALLYALVRTSWAFWRC